MTNFKNIVVKEDFLILNQHKMCHRYIFSIEPLNSLNRRVVHYTYFDKNYLQKPRNLEFNQKTSLLKWDADIYSCLSYAFYVFFVL